jgi:hypothetical protein
MNKKAIAILGAIFILIVGTLGFLIYSKYAGTKTTQAPVVATNSATTTQTTTQTASSTPNNSTNIFQLTADQVLSPALFFDGSAVTYFDHQGNLYQADLINNNGQTQLGTKKQIDGIPLKSGISKILWPLKGNDFMAQLTDQTGKTSWSYFNHLTAGYTDLPSQVESVDWMPTGDKIIYVWLDNGKSTLNIGNPDSTNYQTLADMWENDDQIHVSPDGSQVLYFETQNTGNNNPINSVTSDGKVWKTLVPSGQNFGVLWSPDSQKFLFGKKDPVTQNYQLWENDLTSGEVKNLGLFTTVDKAVWDKDSKTIYAAVPSSGNIGPNSLTQDSFFRMDTSTLDKKQYQSSGSPIDGRDLFLNSTGDKLFFRNAQDGGLYYLDLTQ